MLYIKLRNLFLLSYLLFFVGLFSYASPKIATGLNKSGCIEVFYIDQSDQLIHKRQLPGSFSIPWDGTNNNGKKIPPGIHLCKLHNAEQQEIMKILYMGD